jgi:hypothetical protein
MRMHMSLTGKARLRCDKTGIRLYVQHRQSAILMDEAGIDAETTYWVLATESDLKELKIDLEDISQRLRPPPIKYR